MPIPVQHNRRVDTSSQSWHHPMVLSNEESADRLQPWLPLRYAIHREATISMLTLCRLMGTRLKDPAIEQCPLCSRRPLCRTTALQVVHKKLLLECSFTSDEVNRNRQERHKRSYRRRNCGRKAANSTGCLSRVARTHCPIRSKATEHRAARLSPCGPAQGSAQYIQLRPQVHKEHPKSILLALSEDRSIAA